MKIKRSNLLSEATEEDFKIMNENAKKLGLLSNLTYEMIGKLHVIGETNTSRDENGMPVSNKEDVWRED